jgi:hypothetical protein
MKSKDLKTVCGLDCGDCPHMKEGCKGCNAEKGAPFWTKLVNVSACPVYDCCVNEKHLSHCGLCEQMPCPRFTQIKDHNMTEEQEQECLKVRVATLKRRASGK